MMDRTKGIFDLLRAAVAGAWALMFAVVLSCATSAQTSPGGTASNPSSGGPEMLTLQDALQRAKVNNPDFRAALTDAGLAHEDKVQSRSGMLPNVNYNNGFIYTEPNGTRSGTGLYIANNGVHEYISQGDIHQEVSLAMVADYRRAAAAEALARARAEVAARGLVVTVVQAYYGLVVAQRKYSTEQQALEEAERFLNISKKLEQGGEVAHSDVIKAQIQFQQIQRDFQEARLGMEQARLNVAVLVYPDFNENFSVVDDLQEPMNLPEFAEAQRMAAEKNPDLRAAVAALQVARYDVSSAWSGLLPAGSIDYFYGIDATHFATRQPDPTTGLLISNLGYSVVASVQIPIWNWGANRSRLKQADLRRDQARVELSFAQRKLLSNLRGDYQEAQTAREELESLKQSAEMAADSLRLTTLRYQGGEATVLEVVDAQNTLTLARNAYADGQARYRLAIATLQTVTGSF